MGSLVSKKVERRYDEGGTVSCCCGCCCGFCGWRTLCLISHSSTSSSSSFSSVVSLFITGYLPLAAVMVSVMALE